MGRPTIDGRSREVLSQELMQLAQRYVPDWTTSEGDPAGAVLEIQAHLMEVLTSRLDRVPDTHRLRFLNKIGVQLLPARPARVAMKFVVAADTPTAVEVPLRTQVTADVDGDTLAFETTGPLLALPGALKDLIAVDPFEDRIFHPPPGFLEREPAAATAGDVRVMAIAPAGSELFQVDRLELEEGQLLRFRKGSRQIVRVVTVEGDIVRVTPKLEEAADASDHVEIVSRFDLFSGVNDQQHVLYLGHETILQIASEAIIEVCVEVEFEGATTPKRSWEYFGNAADDDSEDDWRELHMISDPTSGLARSGLIQLEKPAGEIVETEVNGLKNYFIRCRLEKGLKNDKRSDVPRVDLLSLSSQSAKGTLVLPDFVFANTIAIEPNATGGAFPLGEEPRLFDAMYVASTEVLSKRGALVDVTIEAVTPETPSTIRSLKKLYSYKVAASGVLQQLDYQKRKLTPKLLADGVLLDPSCAAAAVAAGRDRFVFACAAVPGGSRQVLAIVLGDKRADIPLPGTPPGFFRGLGAVLRTGLKDVIVIVLTTATGELWANELSVADRSVRSWTSLGSPSESTGRNRTSAPVVQDLGDGLVSVLVNSEGSLWEKKFGNLEEVEKAAWEDLAARVEEDDWTDWNLKPAITTKSGKTDRHEFVVVQRGVGDDFTRLLLRREGAGKWKPIPTPTGPLANTGPIASEPNALRDESGDRVFITTALGELLEWSEFHERWFNHEKPTAGRLRSGAAIIATDDPAPSVYVFAVGDGAGISVFHTLGERDGNIAGTDARSFFLPPGDATDYEGKLLRVFHGPTRGDLTEEDFFIETYDSEVQFLDPLSPKLRVGTIMNEQHEPEEWSSVPDTSDSYLILEEHQPSFEFTCGSVSKSTVVLDDTDDDTRRGDELEFEAGRHGNGCERQWVEKVEEEEGIRTATIAGSWQAKPRKGDHYRRRRVLEGVAPNAPLVEFVVEPPNPADSGPSNISNKEIQLHRDDLETRAGDWIRVTLSDGTEVRRQVVSVTTDARRARVNENWTIGDVPTGTVHYVVGNSGLGDERRNFARACGQSVLLDPTVEPLGGSIAVEGQSYRRVDLFSSKTLVAGLDATWDPPSGQDRALEPDQAFTLLIESGALDSGTWEDIESQSVSEQSPRLAWEYWNGTGWLGLVGVTDGTNGFLKSGVVGFVMPTESAETEVAGQTNHWIRARLVGGGYGSGTLIEETKIPEKTDDSSVNGKATEAKPVTTKFEVKQLARAPIIRGLTLEYTLKDFQAPEACLTYNNLVYRNQTAACRTENAIFRPFEGLEAKGRALYLGFERPLEGSPLGVLLDAEEENRGPVNTKWEVLRDNDWKPVSADDGSGGLTRSGILNYQAPRPTTLEQRLGSALHWLRGTFDENQHAPLLNGVHSNAAWANQARSVELEILGSSNDEPHQIFPLESKPVLENEVIRVQERLGEAETQALTKANLNNVVKDDPLDGSWVLWKEQPDLLSSGPHDRHYAIDRATGEIRFGDGNQGRIPPAGVDNVRAFFYQTGGGTNGNVAPGSIESLATALLDIESVVNPLSAGGGANTTEREEMLELGPGKLSHRGRAVTLVDYELLAREASALVAKARAVAVRVRIEEGDRGWIQLAIVPQGTEPRPQPSIELRKRVREYVTQRSPGGLSLFERVDVTPPKYIVVKVVGKLLATSIDNASKVKSDALDLLAKRLHPLAEEAEFGRGLFASDVHAWLKNIEGLDRVEGLSFTYQTVVGDVQGEPTTSTQRVHAPADGLLAAGEHSLTVEISTEVLR